MNIKKEYPEADFTNIETFKQITINKFTENGFTISKIRNARIKLKNGQPDGIFIYHKYGTVHYQNKREIIEKNNIHIIYRRYKKEYNCDWITTENIEAFQDMLRMTIAEAKNRRGRKIK